MLIQQAIRSASAERQSLKNAAKEEYDEYKVL